MSARTYGGSWIASSPLSFGAYSDGTPNALFDPLSRVVCSFPTDRTVDTRRGSPSTPETILANARLFAAAPDLLAALIDVMSDPYFARAATRYGHARAAIAKAQGGAL